LQLIYYRKKYANLGQKLAVISRIEKAIAFYQPY